MDPQIIFKNDAELASGILSFESGAVNIVEICDVKDNITSRRDTLDAKKYAQWLQQIKCDKGDKDNHTLARIIFAEAKITNPSPNKISPLWPRARCTQFRWPVTLPFSRTTLEQTIQQLSLPSFTPWVCLSEAAHMQRHLVRTPTCSSEHAGLRPFSLPFFLLLFYCDSMKLTPPPGFTMRRSNGGVFGLDIAISISYCLATGCTTALVITYTPEHLEYLTHQLECFSSLAGNPLLLPTLISDHTATILESYLSERWSEYLKAEIASGQSGSDPFGPDDHYGLSKPMEFHSFDDLTKTILRINQLVISYEHYLQQSFLAMGVIRESAEFLKEHALPDRKKAILETSAVLEERVAYLKYKGDVTWWEMQALKQRMQAQTSAIYNFTGQQDNKLNLRIAKINTEIGKASAETALEAKKDSTAMKGIAVITMLFLPGTFMASVFSMPFFSWPEAEGSKLISANFWVFWVFTIPLTVASFVVYVIWYRRHAVGKSIMMDKFMLEEV
ncbi:hypothetical protein B0T16DRAFT_449256 [Cercophora newfieldiana]|uniref:Uncharacterized protein n=1 Tax=Cercophora newfieldiana TaxID=92897 RepID=A0AA40CKP1_9PEZI|nr:hypothetical protein B0T16DRAFT_449256 [Cercophora newfieldiana]